MHSSALRLMLLGVVLLGAIGLYQQRSAFAQATPADLTSTAEAEATATQASLNQAIAAVSATETAIAIPTAVPPITSDPTAVILDPPLAFLVVLTLLILAIFALSRLFTYLTESRQDYYATVREFGGKGVFFSPVMVQPIADALAADVADEAGPTTSFEVTGPGVLAPGQPGLFTAMRNGSAATTATWDLLTAERGPVPPETASLERDPSNGSATLTAAKPGVLTLIATLPAMQPDTPILTVRTIVTIVEPPVTSGDMTPLPFIGQGFGSIISAIVLIAALVVLAATRAIDADVVGVVLGALTGYLFGVGVGNKT